MLIICHYGEIALKGGNRKFFEETLVRNIQSALRPIDFDYACPHTKTSVSGVGVKRISGRIIIKLENESFRDRISENLSRIFGIVNFSFADECKQNIEEIKKKSLEILKNEYITRYRDRAILSTENILRFKVDAKRSEKSFPLTSQEINEQVGEHILESCVKSDFTQLKVDLEKPDITVFIEIVEKDAFIYTEKIAGPGGLPVGVSGKAISLLSGGIDSPVASFMAMKRGLKLIFAHFHAVPYTDRASIEKVKNLAEIIGKFQPKTKLYLVPFSDIQKEILLKTPAPLRVVLYRRMMFRIAGKIAEIEKCNSIITGENLGQVASQTAENLAVIEKASDFLILRPLVSFDKKEIISLAEKIGTYKISILPHEDCCSRFLPEHPETRADLKKIKEAEKKLKINFLIKKSLAEAEIISAK